MYSSRAYALQLWAKNLILLTTTQTGVRGKGSVSARKSFGLVFLTGTALIASAYLKKKKKKFSFYNMLAAFLFKKSINTSADFPRKHICFLPDEHDDALRIFARGLESPSSRG